MDLLSRIADWLGENEATISAVVGIAVLAGIVFAGVRSLVRRRGEAAQEKATSSVAEPASAADSPSPDLDPLTVPGFEGRPAIAVLPFDNLSGDPEQEYFADGVAEDLITRLSAVRLVPVIARNSTFVYRGTSVDVKRVGRELGARYVVEGSVRKAGDRVRITAQLIDATNGHHLWAQHYDRELRDIFAVQDEIIDTIVASLELKLGRAERERAILKAPQNLDAWDCVQRGWWHFFQGTREDLLKAQSLFHEAEELDPHCRLAFSGQALSHLYQVGYQWSEEPRQSLADSLEAAEKSVAVGEDDPMAYFALGMASANTGQYERAVAAFARVIELNPSSASGNWGLGSALAYLGRPDEGVRLIEKAIRLSPHDPVMHEYLFDLGVAHFLAARYEEAIRCENTSLQARPDQPGAYRVLAASYGHLGRSREARAALDAMFRLAPDFSLETLRAHVPSEIVERYLDGWRKAGWEE